LQTGRAWVQYKIAAPRLKPVIASQGCTVKFKIGRRGHSSLDGRVIQQLSSWRDEKNLITHTCKYTEDIMPSKFMMEFIASFMGEGSGMWIMGLGRDPSNQIHELKDLQEGDEWPHWPGKNYLSRAKRQV